MEGQGDNYATTSDIASLRTDMEQTQATLRRLEAFLTSQPGFATAAAATTATASPTTPAAVATPTFHGPMATLSPNLKAARPRLPEAFDPSAKGSDVRRFVATLEIYFEAIGCSTPQYDAARIRLAATLRHHPALNHLFQHGYSVDGEIATAEKQKLLQWEKDLAILLEEFHDVPYAGHFGSKKTLAGIAKYCYWPRMAADVSQFVTSCDTCQRMKSSKQKKTGLLQPLPIPEQPWQVVSLDFITGLPSTSRGHDSILVVIDKFSKMGHFIPTNATATAEATARLFFDRIITIHGIPATLISDRDPKFTSKFWKELMGLLGTKLAMSFAYHPQTDGQTERLNQVVEQLLRTSCKDDVSHWDTQLRTLEFAYNNASHAATGKTPFFLCYGWEPLTPQQPTTPAHVQAAHDFVTTMQQLWEKTQRHDHSIAVGDHVLLDTRNLNLSHLPSKLWPRFCGPFLVEAQVTPVTFRLRLPDTWKLHNAFHVQLLKPYKDPNQQFQGWQLPPPPPVLIQDEPEYEVERVLTHRRRGGKTLEFLLC
ncbi:unnamed protein product [Closterium sp. NIES-53]